MASNNGFLNVRERDRARKMVMEIIHGKKPSVYDRYDSNRGEAEADMTATVVNELRLKDLMDKHAQKERELQAATKLILDKVESAKAKLEGKPKRKVGHGCSCPPTSYDRELLEFVQMRLRGESSKLQDGFEKTRNALMLRVESAKSQADIVTILQDANAL